MLVGHMQAECGSCSKLLGALQSQWSSCIQAQVQAVVGWGCSKPRSSCELCCSAGRVPTCELYQWCDDTSGRVAAGARFQLCCAACCFNASSIACRDGVQAIPQRSMSLVRVPL